MFKTDLSDDSGQSFRPESYPLCGKPLTDEQLHSLFDLVEKIYIRYWKDNIEQNYSLDHGTTDSRRINQCRVNSDTLFAS